MTRNLPSFVNRNISDAIVCHSELPSPETEQDKVNRVILTSSEDQLPAAYNYWILYQNKLNREFTESQPKSEPWFQKVLRSILAI